MRVSHVTSMSVKHRCINDFYEDAPMRDFTPTLVNRQYMVK